MKGHIVWIDGGLPGIRSGKRTEAVATCQTCHRVGRGKTRLAAKKAIKHVEQTEVK